MPKEHVRQQACHLRLRQLQVNGGADERGSNSVPKNMCTSKHATCGVGQSQVNGVACEGGSGSVSENMCTPPVGGGEVRNGGACQGGSDRVRKNMCISMHATCAMAQCEWQGVARNSNAEVQSSSCNTCATSKTSLMCLPVLLHQWLCE